MTNIAYEEQRFEFPAVAARLRPEDRVVDFGCGSGIFLRLIAGKVRRAAGLDWNIGTEAPPPGVEMSRASFADFARSERGRFDVACGFQIIEHLPSVNDLLEPMLDCLDRPATLYLSVPNRARFKTGRLEPLDCPPHHLSRWGEQQIQVLARRYGLELKELWREEPDISVARLLWARDFNALVSRGIPAMVAEPLGRVLCRMAVTRRSYQARAARKEFTQAGVFGHILLAELRAP